MLHAFLFHKKKFLILKGVINHAKSAQPHFMAILFISNMQFANVSSFEAVLPNVLLLHWIRWYLELIITCLLRKQDSFNFITKLEIWKTYNDWRKELEITRFVGSSCFTEWLHFLALVRSFICTNFLYFGFLIQNVDWWFFFFSFFFFCEHLFTN